MSDEAAFLEIEVKFHLDDPPRMADTLLALGAGAHPRIFETNLCFDDDDGSLRNAGKLLRLRKDSGCRLTYKCKSGLQTTDFKVLKELEVEVGDFDRMKAILLALGYHTAQVYEKWRQSFQWNGVWLCIDTLPFGHFLEIEGPRQAIRQTARRLGLRWEDRIVGNYLAIFELLRTALNLPFFDVTFEHFRQHPVTLAPHLEAIRKVGSNLDL
jgi:adenylate cyclase, class 2